VRTSPTSGAPAAGLPVSGVPAADLPVPGVPASGAPADGRQTPDGAWTADAGERPTVALPRPGSRPGADAGAPVSGAGAVPPSTAGREKIGFPLTRPGQAEPEQPYMDADGTLHNLRPIGRLETSGPDTEPRRYADTAFGGGWFVAKAAEKAAGAAGADGSAAAASGSDRPDAGAGDSTTGTDGTGRTTGGATAEGSGAGAEAGSAGRGEAGSGDTATAAAPAGAGRHASASDDDADRTPGTSGNGRSVQQDEETARHGSGTAEETARHGSGTTGETARHGSGTAEETAPGGSGTAGEQAANGASGTAGEQTANGASGTAGEQTANGASGTAGEQTAGAKQARDVPRGPELAPHLPLTATELSAIRWRLDGATLREVVDNRDALRALGERLDGPLTDEADNIVKAGLLSVRAEVYRLLGELGMAAAASRLALAHAESAQDLQSMVIAQAELAHVLRLRGDYLEADRLFQKAVEADVSPAVRSVVHENAGRSCFDQGRNMEALDHFARAIRLGAPEDTDLVERIGVCLEAVYIHVLRDGWGPYPRRSPEILTPLGGKPAEDG
jgi:hypothetical protein